MGAIGIAGFGAAGPFGNGFRSPKTRGSGSQVPLENSSYFWDQSTQGQEYERRRREPSEKAEFER